MASIFSLWVVEEFSALSLPVSLRGNICSLHQGPGGSYYADRTPERPGLSKDHGMYSETYTINHSLELRMDF